MIHFDHHLFCVLDNTIGWTDVKTVYKNKTIIMLQKIIEDIKEFDGLISLNTLDRFMTDFELPEKYSLKPMIIVLTGGKFNGINLLVYKNNLLVGIVCIDKDKCITQIEYNITGIDIYKYTNRCIVMLKEYHVEERNTLSKELGIDYSNTLSVKEKIDLLQKYVDEHPVIIEPKKEKGYVNRETDGRCKPKEWNGVKGKAAIKHKDYIDTIKHLPLEEYKRLWDEYISKNKYKKEYNKKK